MQQPVDLQAVELHEQAEVHDAGDDAVELLADTVLHVVALEPRDGAARRLVGAPLAERAVLPEHRERAVPLDEFLRIAAPQHLADAAVDDEVRVAADRRGEVRVVLEREPEVTDVARLVDGLRHRADDRRRDEQRVRLVAELREQVAQVLGRDLLGRRQPQAELAQELPERLQAVDLGQAVDAIQRRHAMAVEVARRGDVRRDHALLDQPMRVVARLLDQRRDAPLLVELELQLRRVEFERAAPGALAQEAAIHAVQREQPLAQPLEARRVLRRRPLEEFADVAVGQPRGRAHHALEEARARDAAVVADAQLAAQAQPVLVRHQRAQAVRELLRQHRQDAIREVHGRAALARLDVERAAGLHVVADVRDRDDDAPAAARRVRSTRHRRSRARPRRRW